MSKRKMSAAQSVGLFEQTDAARKLGEGGGPLLFPSVQ